MDNNRQNAYEIPSVHLALTFARKQRMTSKRLLALAELCADDGVDGVTVSEETVAAHARERWSR